MPRARLPEVLHAVSSVMPLTYAVQAMQRITVGADAVTDLAVVVGLAVLALVLRTATLRRRSA
ncbi:MAG: hypothetical protein ACTHJH_14070 [Marmoricola sp.]